MAAIALHKGSNMNKRGTFVDFLLTPVLWTVIALGAVLIYLLMFLQGLGEVDVYEKPFLAAASAGVIDAMLVPQTGTVFLLFHPQQPGFKWDYSFDFRDGEVVVYSKKPLEAGSGVYYYADDASVTVSQVELKFNRTIGNMVFPAFLRQGNELNIFDANKDYLPINKFKYPCPGELPKLEQVTLDPGHGFNAEENQGAGLTYKTFKESEITMRISRAISLLKPNLYPKDRATRDLDTDQHVKQEVKTKSVLSIHLNDADEETNIVKAYINAEGDHLKESMNYACRLVNRLTDVYLWNNIPVTTAVIIPIVPNQRSDKSFEILKKEKAGVLLEVGNIKLMHDKENQKLIAGAIKDAT